MSIFACSTLVHNIRYGIDQPEQPKTLLQKMREYLTDRQVLRANGYFVAAGKEPRIDIPRADAIHNDLYAIDFDESLTDSTRDIRSKGNTARIRNVFHSYAMDKFSPE